MTDRYTIKNLEVRVESVNARLERNHTDSRIALQGVNGYTNLYETKETDSSYHRHLTAGTKREIAEYLSAMMTGMDLLT